MRKALLVASFGTGCREAFRDIEAVEAAMAAVLPDRILLRVFTSGFLRRKLAGAGVSIDDVDGALGRLAELGVADVLVQPTFIAAGREYEELLRTVGPWRTRFDRLAVGSVLLADRLDVLAVAEALAEEEPAPPEDEALILLGHGMGAGSNAVYGEVASALRDLGWGRVFHGVVEGAPTCGEVLECLAGARAVSRVRLLPFLLAAGTHVRREITGCGPESWKSRLEAAGYTVDCAAQGLGGKNGIRRLYAAHAAALEMRL